MIVRSVRGAKGWRGEFASWADWLREAAHTSGYTETVLRRYASTLDFVDRLVETDRLKDRGAALQAPEVTLGVLRRLDQIAPDEADRKLAAVLAGQVSYRELLQQYDAVAQARQRHRSNRRVPSRVRKAFLEKCLAMIKQHAMLLLDKPGIDILIIGPDLYRISPDFMLIQQKGDCTQDVCAVECKYQSDTFQAPSAETFLPDIVFEATFFQQLWLVLCASKKNLDHVLLYLDGLTCPSLGVAYVGPDPETDLWPEVVLAPSGDPVPDHRHLTAAALLSAGSTLQSERRTDDADRPQKWREPEARKQDWWP